MARKRKVQQESFFYVYAIKNTITHKFYIGMTKNTKVRWRWHLYGMQTGTHNVEQISQDYALCGESSFVFRVLGKYKDRLEAMRMETFFMKMFRSQNPEYGYNYKDKSGNSIFAKADKWRTSPAVWDTTKRQYHYKRYGTIIPSEKAI